MLHANISYKCMFLQVHVLPMCYGTIKRTQLPPVTVKETDARPGFAKCPTILRSSDALVQGPYLRWKLCSARCLSLLVKLQLSFGSDRACKR